MILEMLIIPRLLGWDAMLPGIVDVSKGLNFLIFRKKCIFLIDQSWKMRELRFFVRSKHLLALRLKAYCVVQH
jgi:hypothetical protein